MLALPEDEIRAACKDLADRLPDLLPADPAMAAILAEELAGAFAEAVTQSRGEGEGAERLANENGGSDETGAWEIVDVTVKAEEGFANEDRESDGTFAPKGTGDQTGQGKTRDAPNKLTEKDFPPPAELSPEGTPIPFRPEDAP